MIVLCEKDLEQIDLGELTRNQLSILNGGINGMRWGWWKGFRWPNFEPIPNDIVVDAADFTDTQTMANVMFKLGFFKSVKEAKRCGWKKPITPGEHKHKRFTIFVR